jgi:hypothetical protein
MVGAKTLPVSTALGMITKADLLAAVANETIQTRKARKFLQAETVFSSMLS